MRWMERCTKSRITPEGQWSRKHSVDRDEVKTMGGCAETSAIRAVGTARAR